MAYQPHLVSRARISLHGRSAEPVIAFDFNDEILKILFRGSKAMELAQQIANVFTLIGIPSIFVLFSMFHRQHTEILKDHITSLEKQTSSQLLSEFKARKEIFETLLGDLNN